MASQVPPYGGLPSTAEPFAVRVIHASQSRAMHVMRGVAALLVVFEHAKNRVFGPETDFQSYGALGVLPRLVFNLGHEAVIVFFVLSGFLVGRKLFQVEDAGGAKRYFADRFTRIYVVAVPALLLSFLAANALTDTIGVSYSQPDVPANCAPALFDLAGNLLLLNKTIVPTICSNSPFWSIQNEVAYYLVFAVAFMAIRLPISAVYRGLCALAVVAIVGFLALEPLNANNTLLYSGFWAAGALLSLLRKWYLGFVLYAVLYGAILAVGITVGGQLTKDVVIGFVVLAMLHTAHRWYWSPAWVDQIAIKLSDISFSLYLFHMPVINTLVSFGMAYNFLVPASDDKALSGWVIICVYVALSLVFAKYAFAMFEQKTPLIRRRLFDRFASSNRGDGPVSA